MLYIYIFRRCLNHANDNNPSTPRPPIEPPPPPLASVLVFLAVFVKYIIADLDSSASAS